MNSRVATRLYVFVLSASLLPLTAAGVFVYNRFATAIEAQVQSDLRETAKLTGLAVLEGLRAGDAELKRVGEALAEGRELPVTRIVDATVVEPSLEVDSLLRRARETGLPRLGVVDNTVYLATVAGESRQPVAAELSLDALLPNPDMLPYGMKYCLETDGLSRHCGRRESDPAPGADAMTSQWILFLGSTFGAPDWQFTVSIPRDAALAPLNAYRLFFPVVTALTALLVTLLLARVIAKILAPVRELTTASRALASGELSARVTIETADEFEALGTAYNTMAARLDRQFDALKSLAELDRRMIEGLELDDLCAMIIDNLRAMPHVSDAAVMVSSELGNDHAMLYCYDDSGAVQVQRRDETTGVFRPSRSEAETLLDGTAFERRHKARDERSEIVVVPVLTQGQASAALIVASTAPDKVEADEDGEFVGLSQRLAVALRGLSRDQELHRRAHYDDLTGLPNRQLCIDRLDQEILFSLRDDTLGAVLFLDLDRFKQINDLVGHSHGDHVLVESAQRLRRLLRSTDSVCRFGGDEFIVLLPRINRPDDAAEVARDVIEALSRPFTVDAVRHFLGVSIGIAIFPDDGKDAETLVKNADAAMYAAKAAGRGQYRFFGTELHERNTARALLERDLRTALSRQDQLSLAYQPKVRLDDGTFAGAEVLLRWQHPTLGHVPPEQFVAIAEECGLIVRLGAWVLQHALIDYAAWMMAVPQVGEDRPVISVNVSPRQLIREQFAEDCIRMVDLAGVERSCIELEITETALADNAERATALVTQLRESGFRISIDDFGTGYSSLAQLTTMPFDALKVDKSFVLGFAPGNQNDTIVRSVVRLAQELGKAVVAEGVETREQLEFLAGIDCSYAQGYYFAKPMPIDELIDYHRRMLPDGSDKQRATG